MGKEERLPANTGTGYEASSMASKPSGLERVSFSLPLPIVSKFLLPFSSFCGGQVEILQALSKFRWAWGEYLEILGFSWGSLGESWDGLGFPESDAGRLVSFDRR